jgi:uncharacterized phage-associated protein
MAKRLRFKFSPEKFANAVAYLAQECPQSTKMTICKHLYFADKQHLVRYGRPITGDHYWRLDHGQIPTRGLNMLRSKASPQENALLQKYVSVNGNSVQLKQQANQKVFSKSDLEVLDWVIQKYGRMSAARLRSLAHKEPSCTEETGPIDYALFFEGVQDAEAVKELAESEQDSRDLLRPYAAR